MPYELIGKLTIGFIALGALVCLRLYQLRLRQRAQGDQESERIIGDHLRWD